MNEAHTLLKFSVALGVGAAIAKMVQNKGLVPNNPFEAKRKTSQTVT